MTLHMLQSNWALVGGCILLAAVILYATVFLAGKSSYGQLRAAHTRLAEEERTLKKQRRLVNKLERKQAKFAKKRDSIKPRVLRELADKLDDARALQKILADKVLVAKNHVRKVIHDEYPQKRHAAMRTRYLPDDTPERRPFSF